MKDRLASLDEKGESMVLSEEECAQMHGVLSDIHSLSRLNTSIGWQQSRVQWLRDGDANSKYFHLVMANRRRRNSLCSILVYGVLVEGVHPIREAIFRHFQNHYQSDVVERPILLICSFKLCLLRRVLVLLNLFR